MLKLDSLDRQLLAELDLDARQPAARLAKKLRKSKETVNFRLNRLLQEKVLKGFYTVIGTSKLGWYYHKMYFRLQNCTPKKEAELFAFLAHQPHVAYLAQMSGPYDGVCLLFCQSAVQMDEFLHSLMGKFGEYIQSKEFATFLTVHRFNQKFLHRAKERKDWSFPTPLGHYTLDALDSKILGVISSNARLPLTEIAQKAGTDAQVVKYRLQKLEREGIIIAYVSSPNFEQLGLRFIQINISLKDPAARKPILKYFDSTDACLYGMEMIGRYDLAVELHMKGDEQLAAIVNGFREKFISQVQDYDLSTITKEHVVVWGPFKEKD